MFIFKIITILCAIKKDVKITKGKVMNNKRTIFTILFFGGLWGIIEATLGYLVHFLPTGFPGMIMFPIAFYFMYSSYKNTNKQSAVFFTALVAGIIKLSDLFIPLKSTMSAINPAVSIVLESLIVFAFIKSIQKIEYILNLH